MWRNHRIIFQDHLKYICNDIVKPLCVGILCHSKHVQDMHYLAKYLPTPSRKGDIFEEAIWKVRDKELSEHDIQVSIKYRLHSSMQDELEDNQ